MPNCAIKHGVVGIQTIRRMSKANRRKSTSNNRQTPTKELKRFEIVQGSNQPDEPIHTEFGKLMSTPEAIIEERKQMEIGKRTRRNIWKKNKQTKE